MKEETISRHATMHGIHADLLLQCRSKRTMTVVVLGPGASVAFVPQTHTHTHLHKPTLTAIHSALHHEYCVCILRVLEHAGGPHLLRCQIAFPRRVRVSVGGEQCRWVSTMIVTETLPLIYTVHLSRTMKHATL